MNGTVFVPDATSALQTVLAVSVLMAIVLVARRHVARHFGAGVAYALWAIPVARLLLPPMQMPVSLMPLLRWPFSAQSVADSFEPAVMTARTFSAAGPMIATPTPPAPAMAPSAPLPDAMHAGIASPGSLPDIAFSMLLPALFFLWAGGALFVFGLSLWRQHVFMQTVKREAVTVSPRLQQVARIVGQQVGLKRLPVIASSFISSGPLVTGLFRPVVLLPAWFETDYDDVQQRAALAHELTHVRRGDLIALQVAELFVACLWFNPLAHLAHRAFRTDQEAACDADVLKTGTASPHAYGSTLIKAVKSAAQERLPAAAGLPLTHALKERLNRMTHPAPTRTRRLIGGTAAGVLGVAALIATSSVTANASEPQRKELRIDGSTVWLNGEQIKDRQIVILGEPFENMGPNPEIEAEIARISAEMSREGAKFGEITARIAAEASAAASPEDDAEYRALMEELANLPLETALPINDFPMTINSDMTDEEREALGEKWAAWGEQMEERADAWAAAYEARAEKLSAAAEARAEKLQNDLEPQLEKMSAELEARMDAKSAELDRLIERAYGDDFEARVEATSDAVDALVQECRDADLAEGETRVLSNTIKTGSVSQEVKIACVKGNRAALTSARTLAAIDDDKSLCESEKRAFHDHLREHDHLQEDGELAGADE